MEKEVSHAVEIGVTLFVLSLVISIIWFTVFLGKSVETDAIEQGTRVISDVQEGVLQDMVGQQNDITTATAYGIARTYGSLIPSANCKICGKATNLVKDTPCLLNHMHGKVSVEVSKVEDSWYEIIIHKENCTWFYGTCNCASLP